MRDAEGGALWHAATLSDATGAARIYAADEVRFIPLRHWRSPRTGIEYPVEWEVVLAGERSLRLRPLLDDQELDSRSSTGAIYWEGAVHVFERDGAGEETEIGQGYLEMTGYAARLQM
ncbi:lipocalin family protein, partial [Arthrospira platensis SPKY1]|nr:lipocalin family protein [Arthrospira platensis SPKY1]